jgi:hypothetical protein
VSVSATAQYQTAVVSAGDIFISSDYGINWTQITIGPLNFVSVSISATGQYQTVLVNGGYIYNSSDYGVTWTQNTGAGTGGWNIVSISATGQYQTAVDNTPGFIYTSSNYGLTWTQNTGAGTRVWRSVSLSKTGQYQTAVAAPGGSGYIYISSDYGVTWTQNTGAGLAGWFSVSVSATGQYQTAVVISGYIYNSSDYGVTWTQNTGLGASFWSAVSVSATAQYQTAVVSGGYIYTCSVDLVATSFLNTTLQSTFTVKTFVIDHPRSASKYLIHACLEGPEAGVYYRGKGEVDNDGNALVNLPSYVDAFATDLTVNVTPIYNGNVRTLNATEVCSNQFKVFGNPGPFHWHVYGKRQSIIVEPEKSNVELKGSGPYKWLG